MEEESTTSLTATSRSRSWSRPRHTTPMAPRPIGWSRMYRPAMTRPVIGGIAGPYQRSGVAADGEERTRRLGEEVVALVVHDDERGEVADLYPPHRLHAEFRVFQHFDLGDEVLRKPRRRTADRAEVEPAVPFARLGYPRGPVALGQHNERPARRLESFNISVHPPARRRPERPGRVPGGGLGRPRVVHGMIAHIRRHGLAGVEPLGDLRVG